MVPSACYTQPNLPKSPFQSTQETLTECPDGFLALVPRLILTALIAIFHSFNKCVLGAWSMSGGVLGAGDRVVGTDGVPASTVFHLVSQAWVDQSDGCRARDTGPMPC